MLNIRARTAIASWHSPTTATGPTALYDCESWSLVQHMVSAHCSAYTDEGHCATHLTQRTRAPYVGGANAAERIGLMVSENPLPSCSTAPRLPLTTTSGTSLTSGPLVAVAGGRQALPDGRARRNTTEMVSRGGRYEPCTDSVLATKLVMDVGDTLLA